MHDFEKLGAFYLGKAYDLQTGERGEEIVLYDSKDLTTHAMIIGMTGSGKTGLGIALLEEAAIDRIPVIAVDPKGDLGNLLLAFPELSAERFRPWVNPDEAATKGLSIDDFAAATARTWQQGLADWGQGGERIRKLLDTVDLAIYTPGSSAGLPISVLRSFAAPPPAAREDQDLYRERIQATASSVLGLLGIEADPITSREHVLIATILQHAWNNGVAMDVAGLIQAISKPPFERIGVLDVETFYPAKERFALAMQLNTLLAAPGFEAWMQGEPLDTARLLFTPGGKPRVAVISIAHLSDRERMFFVSMLLNDMINWMRAQPGTSSLRAIFYMDELFGYMPPVSNPPSKPLLLTLLKQARAFGLGVVLSTQNPVDLDYKGLSNIGTWFIGRLQTERDKARVMEGLEGAAAGRSFDRAAMEQTLAALGKRVFLMRNVHEDAPVVFTTRWVLSYLAGPLTREQIKTLTGTRRPPTDQPAASPGPAPAATVAAAPVTSSAGPPALAAGIRQFFLPCKRSTTGDVVYRPLLIGAADISFSQPKYDVQETRRVLRLTAIDDGAVPVDWADARELALDVASLEQSAAPGASFADLPASACSAKSYTEWAKLFTRWLRTAEPITLLRSPTHRVVARPGESEGAFRARLQHLGREQRDDQVEALRAKYAAKLATLVERQRRAEQTLQKEQAQAQARKVDTVASIGSSLVGAFLGRKRAGTALAQIGTAYSRTSKEGADVEHAAANLAQVNTQITELEAELQAEIDAISSAYDAQTEALETIEITPKASDVHVHFVGLAWAPYVRDAQGTTSPAW